MTKTLQMDEATARRLYPTAAPEFKEMLEQNFGKDFFNPINPYYKEVCDYLQVSTDDSTIKIEVPNFDADEINLVKTFVKKVRISKFYRKGRPLPKKGDNRFYYWHELSSSSPSGLRFNLTSYGNDFVHAASAAHLSFLSDADARDAGNKFMDIDSDFYSVK